MVGTWHVDRLHNGISMFIDDVCTSTSIAKGKHEPTKRFVVDSNERELDRWCSLLRPNLVFAHSAIRHREARLMTFCCIQNFLLFSIV